MYKMLIDGKSEPGNGELIEVVNPDSGEVFDRLNGADAQQCVKALEAADKAFNVWSKMKIKDRVKILYAMADEIERNKDDLAELLISETGKTYSGACGDIQMLPDCLRFFAEESKRLYGTTITDSEESHLNVIQYQPKGVVVGYLAWNFPILNLGYKMGAILASGCTCILKPSTVTPLTTLRIGELLAGFLPAGTLNIIAGNTEMIGKILNESKIPSMITLIGSSGAGRKIMEQSTTSVKHFSLELGGNAPAIVMADADIDSAVKHICNGKFSNAGQVCVSPNRVFVHKAVIDKFIEGVLHFTSGITLGCGKTSGRFVMGPLSTESAVKNMESFVSDAVSKGGNVACGGKRTGKGYYFMSTVITGVKRNMDVYRKEVFGPIMSVIEFDDSDAPAELANDTEYGLAAYIYTASVSTALRLSEEIKAGDVSVNSPKYGYNLPHGGLKESGIGKDCSFYSIREYCDIKRISIDKGTR